MKQSNLALSMNKATNSAIVSKPIVIKGISSVLLLTSSTLAAYSPDVQASPLKNLDHWKKGLDSGSGTITITGENTDSGAQGKFTNLGLITRGAEYVYELKSDQKLLIEDTAHSYKSNYIEARNAGAKFVISGGTIELNRNGNGNVPDAGLKVYADNGAVVELIQKRLNVNAELHLTAKGDTTQAKVSADNITIGTGKSASGDAVTKVVAGADSNGIVDFGQSHNNIVVNNDGALWLHASKSTTVRANNISINGGTIEFRNGSAQGRTNFHANRTDVNDGALRVSRKSRAVITNGEFNLNGDATVELTGPLQTSGTTLYVGENVNLAASAEARGTDAQLSVADDSTLKLSKAKLKEFLTGMKGDGSKLVYKDGRGNAKEATQGNIALSAKLAISDESFDVANKDEFNFSSRAEAGAIAANDKSLLIGKNVSVSKHVDNASKLSVYADNLSLGSEGLDSSNNQLGLKKLYAEHVEFIPQTDRNNYTLQDDLQLQSNRPGIIKGSVTIDGGRITITGGSHYELEQGKDLVIAKDGSFTDTNAQPQQGSALTIKDGSLVVSGKLHTIEQGSIKISEGSLDASKASALKIAKHSIKLGENSTVILNGNQIIDVSQDKHQVVLYADALASEAFENVDNSTTSTVTLKNLDSMTKDQYKDLRTKTGYSGYFNGFSISDSEAKSQMDIAQIEESTPDLVYGNTQVTTAGVINNQVSIGSVELTAASKKLLIESQGAGGSLVKLTNASANSNQSNNFVQDSSGAVAEVEISGSKTSLQLQGYGNIGSINASQANEGKLFIGSVDKSSKAIVNVKGDIGNSQPLSQIRVHTGSNLNIEGNHVKADQLKLDRSSHLAADKASVSIASTSTIYGDLRAKELRLDSNNSKAIIAGSGSIELESLRANPKAYIQVGEDDLAGQNGTLLAQKMDLNGGSLFVDPSFDQEASYAVVQDLSGSASTSDAGVLNGSAYVGKNAVLAVGFNNKEDVVAIIKSKLNGHGAFTEGSGVENALVLNKKISLDGNDKVLIDPKIKASTDGAPSTPPGAVPPAGGTLPAATITFGDSSALIVTNKVFESGAQGAPKSGAAITIKGATPTVNTDKGGVVILSGRFSEADKDIQIFASQNGGPVTLSKDVSVQSTNGLIAGTLRASNGGRLDKLRVDKDRLRTMFKNTSKPVADMLENVLTGQIDVYEDESKAGAQFVAQVATDSSTAAELDRAVHAASFAGAQQAAIYASNAMTKVMMERGDAINNSRLARHYKDIYTQAYYKATAKRRGNSIEVTTPSAVASKDSTGVWVSPTYVSSEVDGYDAHNASYGADIDIKGVSLGTDTRIGDVAVGIAASYGKGDSDGTGQGKGLKDDFDYYGLGLYTAMSFGQFSLIGDTSVTAMKHDITGASGIQGFGNLSASVDSLAISAGVTGKYMFETPFMDITPHFGTRFLRLSTDSYDLYSNEAKSNLINTNYDAQNIFSFPVGVNLSKHFNVNGWIVNPDIDLTVTANVGDTDAKSSNKIYGMKSPLDLTTQVMDDVTYRAKLGLGVTNGNFNSNLYFDYTGSKNTESYGISANVGYDF